MLRVILTQHIFGYIHVMYMFQNIMEEMERVDVRGDINYGMDCLQMEYFFANLHPFHKRKVFV